MSNEQVEVLIGKLGNPTTISQLLDSGARREVPIGSWDERAMWQYLRLRLGHERADHEINRLGLGFAFDEFWNKGEPSKIVKDRNTRDIQFIMNDEMTIKAVATLAHLLIDPLDVYQLAARLVKEKYGAAVQLQECEDLLGVTFDLGKVSGFTNGLQVFGGNILTRNAITVTTQLRVQSCFNPLSWLQISEVARFVGGGAGAYERVLRIKKISELEPRIRTAIDQGLERVKLLEKRVEVAKAKPIDEKTARLLMGATGLSYHLGAPTVNQVVDQWLSEEKTLWGLSMASSYIAGHGRLRKTAEDKNPLAKQKLATIAGACILIDSVESSEKRAVEWLRKHVKAGHLKTVDEVLQGVVLE